MPDRKPFQIGGEVITPGTTCTVNLEVAKLYTHTQISMPVFVNHSKKEGPILFVSAGIHGDEINGVEIVRRLIQSEFLSKISGTLIAIPVVNVMGFLQQSRYLPDRRDLNRSFPGSPNGSLAARLAYLFLNEIVDRSQFGIDLHTGAIHRSNLPQVRGNFNVPEVRKMAEIFGAPVMIDAKTREGSLREAMGLRKIPVLVYETGEALRFDNVGIEVGLRGIYLVMRQLGMIGEMIELEKQPTPKLAKSSFWIRSPEGGILITTKKPGDMVEKGETLGTLSDPFGERATDVKALTPGIVIGMTKLPLVNRGDALFHVAVFEKSDAAEEVFKQVEADFGSDLAPDEYSTT